MRGRARPRCTLARIFCGLGRAMFSDDSGSDAEQNAPSRPTGGNPAPQACTAWEGHLVEIAASVRARQVAPIRMMSSCTGMGTHIAACRALGIDVHETYAAEKKGHAFRFMMNNAVAADHVFKDAAGLAEGRGFCSRCGTECEAWGALCSGDVTQYTSHSHFDGVALGPRWPDTARSTADPRGAKR